MLMGKAFLRHHLESSQKCTLKWMVKLGETDDESKRTCCRMLQIWFEEYHNAANFCRRSGVFKCLSTSNNLIGDCSAVSVVWVLICQPRLLYCWLVWCGLCCAGRLANSHSDSSNLKVAVRVRRKLGGPPGVLALHTWLSTMCSSKKMARTCKSPASNPQPFRQASQRQASAHPNRGSPALSCHHDTKTNFRSSPRSNVNHDIMVLLDTDGYSVESHQTQKFRNVGRVTHIYIYIWMDGWMDGGMDGGLDR